jgi:hypothetical protein
MVRFVLGYVNMNASRNPREMSHLLHAHVKLWISGFSNAYWRFRIIMIRSPPFRFVQFCSNVTLSPTSELDLNLSPGVSDVIAVRQRSHSLSVSNHI